MKVQEIIEKSFANQVIVIYKNGHNKVFRGYNPVYYVNGQPLEDVGEPIESFGNITDFLDDEVVIIGTSNKDELVLHLEVRI